MIAGRRLLASLAACSLLLTPFACARPVARLPPRRPAPPKKDYYRELPPGAQALRKITNPAEIPDFTTACADTAGLLEAVNHSLSYLAKPSSRGFFPSSGIAHDTVVQSLRAFDELLRSGKSPAQMNAELRQRFDVYTTVGYDDRGGVLFTGYYTPIFDASLEETARMRWPLHRLPGNHVKDSITGETKGLRRPDGSVDPSYPSRAELLASGALRGGELVWLVSPFEAYLVGVQGSAVLRLPGGEHYEVGYAGTNGHPYTSLGLQLVAAGKLRREELNLRNMLAYFQAHPEDYAALAAKNARYVFFEESTGGPHGCINEPVIAGRTIATDKAIFPRASLCFLNAKLPDPATGRQAQRTAFVLDQDAGGAIRAPGRCDVYMGIGDAAGDIAGRTLAEGRLYYLFLKDDQIAYGGGEGW